MKDRLWHCKKGGVEEENETVEAGGREKDEMRK